MSLVRSFCGGCGVLGIGILHSRLFFIASLLTI